MITEKEEQDKPINPERIIERLERIEFQLSIKQPVENGKKEQPDTLVN